MCAARIAVHFIDSDSDQHLEQEPHPRTPLMPRMEDHSTEIVGAGWTPEHLRCLLAHSICVCLQLCYQSKLIEKGLGHM